MHPFLLLAAALFCAGPPAATPPLKTPPTPALAPREAPLKVPPGLPPDLAALFARAGKPAPPPADNAAAEGEPGLAARKKVALAVHAATVRVQTPSGSFGAGFCRRLEDGSVWVWTAGHVAVGCRYERKLLAAGSGPLEGKPRVSIEYAKARVSLLVHEKGELVGRREWDAEVIRCDTEADLALLRIVEDRPAGLGSLQWARGRPEVADPVVACGTPRGKDGHITWGRVSTVGDRNPKTDITLDRASCGTQPGNSGGPVCMAGTGLVLGLVQGGPGETCTTIVPAREARKWAQARGVLFAFDGTGKVPSLESVRKGGVELLEID